MSLRVILSTVTDPDTRRMTGGIALTCLIAFAFIASEIWSRSFPYRSARAAVREALADPNVQVDGARIVYLPSGLGYGRADQAVCGTVRGTGLAFAVAEEEPGGRRNRGVSWAASGEGVFGVAIEGRVVTDRDLALLALCHDIGA